MTKKPKLGKIGLVIFLTILIWVWADLAQDEKLPLPNRVTIAVAPSGGQASWIVFKKDENSTPRPVVSLDSVDLKGPAKRVAEVRRMQEKGTLDLVLYLDPKRAGLESEGSHLLDVMSFLRQNDQIRRLGLTVESCEPQTLTVLVQHLVEKSVVVQCVDVNDHVVSAEMIDPPQVKVLVPEDEVAVAKVRLSADEQLRARTTALVKTASVELAPGQTRNVPQPVRVKLPSLEAALKDYPVHATLGICFSPVLQGKYQVKLQNEDSFATVPIRATGAAEQEFENQSFHIILYIHDSDAEKPATEVIEREVVFNFPPQYVQRQEIKEGRPLDKAKFTLVPVSSDVKPAAPK